MEEYTDMDQTINIYSDETSHANDGHGVMLLGATWANKETVRRISESVKLIKWRHNISVRREIKWTKVSPSKLEYYKELIDLFINDKGINFRAVIIDKATLDHDKFDFSEDDFYYRMQYYLVRNIATKRPGPFRLYLDYKDTWSNRRCQELSDILSNTSSLSQKDFTVQPVRSHEVTPLQLADLILGAVMYANKPHGQNSSKAKQQLVKHLERSVGQPLNKETPFALDKFNLFFWEPRK